MLTDEFRYQYSRGVPVSRMFDHLSLAHSCGVSAVRDITIKGMARNFDEIAELEDFLEVKADDLLSLIRADELHARSDDRLTYLHDIVKSLRVGLVSAGTISPGKPWTSRSCISTVSVVTFFWMLWRRGIPTIKSLEQLKKDHSQMFLDRTNSLLAKTRYRMTTPQRQEQRDCAAEAFPADCEKCIIYIPDKTPIPFENWFQTNLPSQVKSEDGIGWICVTAPNALGDVKTPDLAGFYQAWDRLQLHASREKITAEVMKDVAKKYGVTCGKWLFYADSVLNVDDLWGRIARAVVAGRCGMWAKVSSNKETGEHVVATHNEDYTDFEAVCELERDIRKAGIIRKLFYKPVAYTYADIYRGNQWGIRPAVYDSVYDLKQGCSQVTDTSK